MMNTYLRLMTAALLWLLIGASEVQAQRRFGWGSGAAAQRAFRETNRQVRDADKARKAGELERALTLYRQASATFGELKRAYLDSDIDHTLVGYRLQYCQSMVEKLASRAVPDLLLTAGMPDDSHGQPTLPQPDAPGQRLPSAVTESDPPADGAATAEADATADWPEQAARVRHLVDSGRYDAALQTLQQDLNRYPHSTHIRLMLAYVFIEQGKYDDALLTLMDLPETVRTTESVLLLQAAAQFGEGLPFDALLSLDRALQVNPHSPQAYMNLAWLRYRMNPQVNVREAEAFYRFAVRLGAPRDPRLEGLLGMEER